MSVRFELKKDFNSTLDEIGFVGSIFAGSLISFNDYGDETVTWSFNAGSMYFRSLNNRELFLRKEGKLGTGENICYISGDNRLTIGSRYQIFGGEDSFDVMKIQDYPAGGSPIVYQKLQLQRIGTN